jgi:trans-aconitate 2-methyltransferase
MPTWNAEQYLKFAEERTRPCRDLVSSISLKNAGRLMDLGCGPGNSTIVLAGRWPDAEITGLDSAVSMIDVARREQPQHRWVVGDIAEWASSETRKFDLVFSNAALQWVPDHASIFPNLFARLNAGGALAVQIPADFDALPHRIMRELAPSARVKGWYSHPAPFYYDLLAPLATRVDIWTVEYQHVLQAPEEIVEWYKGSGMRPFLESFESAADREKFLAGYTERIRGAYPRQPDSRVLFPFKRLFLVAYA